jgi:DNA-binding transcriptional LysR family regulator
MARLDDMRIFAKVAETGGFSVAADALKLPKQSVSRRIATLEAALRTRLLHRTTRTVAVTEAGAAYAIKCAEVVRLADDANANVMSSTATPSSTLRIAADPHFAETFLSEVLFDYAEKY